MATHKGHDIMLRVVLLCILGALMGMVSAELEVTPSCEEKCTCTKRKAAAAEHFRNGDGYVFFQHLHKAGGSTMCSLISRSSNVKFGANTNCNVRNAGGGTMRFVPESWDISIVEEFMNTTKRNAIASEDKPFSHHWGLAHPDSKVDNSRWSFLTMLRHPVERILSHYQFENIQAKTGKTLHDWVTTSPFHTQNFMVRMYAGLIPPGLPKAVLDQPSISWPGFDKDPKTKGWFAPEVPAVTREDLETAKRVLDQFTVVIIMESLTESAALLKHWFNFDSTDDTRARHWKGTVLPPLPTHQNTTGNIITPSGIYKNIFDLNSYDLELYEYAKMLTRCATEHIFFRDASNLPERECIGAHKRRQQDPPKCWS